MRTSSYSSGLRLLAILALGLSATAVTASPVSQAWAVRIDGPTDTSLVASGMAVGPSGDVYLTGSFRSGGYYLRDILTLRRSPSGAPVWQRSYQPPEGSSANESPSAILAHGTNIYVTGSITTTNGKTDFLTLKYRETGELEWSVRTERPTMYSAPVAIAIDPAGNIVLLESSGVLKYGPTGNLLWSYSYDGPVRTVEMRVDAGGNIYVAGTAGASSLDSTPVTFKLDSDGHELWRAAEASVNLQGGTVNGLDVDAAGNVVTVARDQMYSMVWKYDVNGSRQWMARYRAEEPLPVYANDVRFDASGNLILAAQLGGDALLIKYAANGQQLWASRLTYSQWPAYLGVLDLDGAGNSYLTTSYGDDMILVKVNPEGAQLWSATYNSQENAQDSGEFLKVMPSGDIFMAGRSFYSGQNFVSLVKYTQQTVTGVATALVTPALQVVDRGADVVLTAETTGPGPLHFQWRKNGQLIPDATNAVLSLTNVQALDRAEYSVILSNATSRTVSPEARLSVRVPPEVFIDPTQALAYIGTDIGFAATVAGNDFATLQWRHNGTNIPGATNGILQLTTLNAAAGGRYDIVVSTFGGSTTSSAAGLKISRAVELINRTAASGDDAPLFSVLPSGEFLIAASSNHLTGSTIVLHQHETNGAILWSAAFESMEFTNAVPSHLARDGAGNIYLTGLSLQPYLAAAWVLLKFSPDGQLLWSRIHTGTNLLSHIDAFAVDSDGNSTAGALGQFGTTVVRYDTAGELQWVFNNTAMDDDTIALAVDSSGNSYLGTTILTNGYNEVRLRKFDSAGTNVWTRRHEPGIHHRLGTIAVDSADHLVVAGNGFMPGTEDGQMFVAKYSPTGQRLWETRVGSSWREVASIAALAIGPNDAITVLTRSDDDYEPGEQSNLTRLGPDGQLKYHIPERQIFVSGASQLALDHFGNAYVTGFGWRAASGMDSATAKYDAYGSRHWLVYHGGLGSENWGAGLAIGVDAAADVRVLASGFGSGTGGDFGVLHYRQRDPAGAFRVQLIRDGAGTFHLGVPSGEPFQIEASTDLQNWSVVTESAAQQLLQPGATSFSTAPQRFYRLTFQE